ncbi:hypothetical protein [Desulfobacter sp.]|uniref:hypothetical protein n=1 Tax=Desulfobacter sp. TaxID=2294 RepID=UPI003D0F6C75
MEYSETKQHKTPLGGNPAGNSPAEPVGAFPLEYCDKNEVQLDYTMRPYHSGDASATPWLRNVNLLYLFLDNSHEKERWRRLINGIRGELGENRTVWGIKMDGKKVSMELYFYFRSLSASSTPPDRPGDIPPQITWPDIKQALSKSFCIIPDYPVPAPAVMVSVDVDDTVLGRGEIDMLHIYTGSGLSYDVTLKSIEHVNTYHFFELAEQPRLEEMVRHLTNGMMHSAVCGVDIQHVLLPQLYSCRTICLAAKRFTDGIYFSGIKLNQLAWFLKQYDWPGPVCDFVLENGPGLSHLRWDVGLDFTGNNGRIQWKKRGIYGTL